MFCECRTRSTPDCTRTSTVPRAGGHDGRHVGVVDDGDGRGRRGAEEDLQVAGGPGEVLADHRHRRAGRPDVALRPVTTGVRSTTSKSLKCRLFRPWIESWMSLSFQVSVKLLLASTE